ncbi:MULTISPECIES: alpha-ketoglutarate-dependent dioxygenase AlkB [Pseudoalteromonas]|mgnify:FL=1|uniref:Alpha-ketoglutarate-dependent dioxygenase AlkB n=1 Tax=Pseudoalteromonas distincta TaxID=77608 RepID=A0A4P9J2R3_9GAMM|nr:MULTISPECIES: alpha-ketoglutarate-dependent dioxygenase AlkB [Pseudoalteromonas]KAA1159206.1 alpha-ketoglutarate-dependent dioxygenase AlkB [Pseudoalteromonas distincta]KHM44537.1 2OG-Fe(II) oxygenase [Pseudoalteromonas elyakovii]KID40070.1 2OG-Fe(II) oxygenase [Pseudoalteromonas distincta]MBB1348444.1 alpha-ketoglutarate-dependent dioxygenase AlkB [Pseudoalteromonas sp. SG45-3]MBB1359949.1 alpha-ketoglutarate-dependent dioxygenase AlkB [Pseudoalteromonas sp. SG45-6]
MQRQNANPQQLPNGFSYQSRALSAQKSLDLFYYLQKNLRWQQPDVTVYGKTGPIPRLQCFMSDLNIEYGYSSSKQIVEPWDELLLNMRRRLEAHLNQPLNSLLVNYYRDGNDTMGWHSDDEIELGDKPTIVCVSLGADRILKLKHKASNKVTDLKLQSGSCLIMNGHSQRDYQHAIPKQTTLAHPRISLTYRFIKHIKQKQFS